MISKKSSFALVTRLQWIEAPFVNEFLAYYKNLGIDSFYLVNTEPKNRELIANEISSEFKGIVELIDKRPEDDLEQCPNGALKRIREKFLLHVDMDEFLYLDGMTLHKFINHEGLQGSNSISVECFFNWVMSPLCEEVYAPSIQEILSKKYFFPSRDGKTLARTQDIKRIKPHYFRLNGQKNERRYDPITNNYFVFHVAARGILDILNKVQFSKFKDSKYSREPDKELFELIFDKTSNFLPSRFVLLAFQSRFALHTMNLDFEYPKLEHGTNTELLIEITLNGLKDVLGVEVDVQDLEKTILDKLNRYVIPVELVDAYAAGDINLLKVIEYLQDPERVG